MRRIMVIMLVLCLARASLGAVYWDNSEGDNDFSNSLNWKGDGGPTSLPAVNMVGADRAIVGNDTSSLGVAKLYVGNNAGTAGEVEVQTNGTLYASQWVYVGYHGAGTLTVNGGTVKTNIYDVLIGNYSDGSGTLTMNSGLIDCQRFFAVGNGGTGTMTMNGGTVNVNTYDFQIGDDTGSSGTLNMHGGVIDVARDVTVGGEGVGVLNMYGGVINAAGKITIPELTGGNGTLNLYDGTINAKLWMRNAEYYDPSNQQLVNIKDGQIVMADGDGSIAATMQSYINNGWVVGMEGYTAQAVWDETNLTTTVFAVVPEPATLIILGLGSLAIFRKRK